MTPGRQRPFELVSKCAVVGAAVFALIAISVLMTAQAEDWRDYSIDEIRRIRAQVTDDQRRDMLDKVVTGMQTQLPLKVDEITVLQAVVRLGNNKIAYKYRLSIERSLISSDFEDRVKAVLVHNWCSAKQTRFFLELGFIPVAVYTDGSGYYVHQVEVSRQDCE